MAHVRQVSTTSQRRQMAFASSIWKSAGPVLPIGKNSSGSSPRHVARLRHVIWIKLPGWWSGKSSSCESAQSASVSVTRLCKVKTNGNGNVKRVHVGCHGRRPHRHLEHVEPGDLQAGEPFSCLDALRPVP